MKLISTVIVALVALVMGAQGNMITNGDFQITTTTNEHGLMMAEGWDGTPVGGYVSANWGAIACEAWNKGGQAADDTSQWLFGWWTNWAGGIYQMASGVVEGTSYDISADFYKESTFSATSLVFKLEFYTDTSSWTKCGDTVYFDLDGLTTESWVTLSTNIVAPVGATTYFVCYESSGNLSGGGIGMDNVSMLEAVPEPVSAALAVFGLGLCYLIRRKIMRK